MFYGCFLYVGGCKCLSCHLCLLSVFSILTYIMILSTGAFFRDHNNGSSQAYLQQNKDVVKFVHVCVIVSGAAPCVCVCVCVASSVHLK